MDPVQVTVLGVPGIVLLWALTVISFGVFGWRTYQIVRLLTRARPENRFNRWGERCRHVVKHVESDDSISEIIPGVVAIVLLFGGPVVIVALVSFNNRRKREMVHQTINKIIEQGRDVPVELLDALDKGKNGKSMLAKGTINVALGIGIGAWLWAISGPDVATVGLIPLCIGFAQLVNWKLEHAQAARGATS